MWPFDKGSTNKRLDEAVAALQEARKPSPDGALQEAVAKLNKRLDVIEMEWQEWFDKFRRLYARLAKRQEREAEAEAEPVNNHSGSNHDAPQSTIARAAGVARLPRRNY